MKCLIKYCYSKSISDNGQVRVLEMSLADWDLELINDIIEKFSDNGYSIISVNVVDEILAAKLCVKEVEND